jgi:hypothetical protein
VIDPATEARLQDLLRRERRSLLEYVAGAYPWANRGKRDVWPQLRRVIDEERQALAAIAQFLTRQRVPLPPPGPFPEHFTSLNFVALDYLLPQLVEAQRRASAALEHDLARLPDGEAQRLVRELLAVKQRHLQTLEGLAAPHPQAASA